MSIKQMVNGDSANWKLIIRISAVIMPVFTLMLTAMGTLIYSDIRELKLDFIKLTDYVNHRNSIYEQRNSIYEHRLSVLETRQEDRMARESIVPGASG